MTSSSSDSDFHVTFSLPSSAAALLKELADGGNQGLRDLGVVSVHINSPAFREGCTASPRKSARESEVPLSANTSHLDRLNLSCHSFPSQDDLENTRQNIRHYLSMQMGDTGNVDYAVPNRNASAPTQPLEMPRHIPDMSPMNALGHSLSFAEASQMPLRHRLDSARSLVSEVDHGHQQKIRNADAECWKPACSSYWNWPQNHYRLAYADVAVDGYGSHSGLARPLSPMYARSPPYAFNPCSPRLRTGYQMLPPSHFQEPFAHLENERAWQHTSHTTSPYLMNLLHSNSSHAAKNQRLAGPFETVLALPSGQTKKKFHRSRKDVALTRPASHAMDPSSALGSVSAYDGPGTLGFGPGQSSFAFPMAHSVCHPDTVEQNQQIYAAAQSAHVNKSQANAFFAPSSRVSTSCLVTSPPAFAMPTSAHVATAAAYVTSPSESVMLKPAHAMLTTECAVSTSRVALASTCSESPQAPGITAAMSQLTSIKLMSSSAHPHVFLTSAHVMPTPQHVLCTSAHATSLPKDVLTVPLCHVTPVSSHVFSDVSSNAVTKPVRVESTPLLGITSPAITTSTVKQIVATTAASVTMTRASVDSSLTCVASAHISPEFTDRQFFRSSSSEAGVVAAGECRTDCGSKSKMQDDHSAQCSSKEISNNLDTCSHDEQVCNSELERLPDLTKQRSRTTCSVDKTPPLTILPAVGSMGSVYKDQGFISCSSEFMSARKVFSAGRASKSPVQSSSNEIEAPAIISDRKPEDAESQPDASSISYPSSTVDKLLPDTSASVSSSHTNEMTSIDCRGSITAYSVSQAPMSITTSQKTKTSSLVQEPRNMDVLDLGSDHGMKMQSRSEDSGTMSVVLPPVISNTLINKKATEEMMVNMHVVAHSIPTIVDNGHARFQGVHIAVQDNNETLAPDDLQSSAASGSQSVCSAAVTIGSLKPTLDTFIATDDSTENDDGRAHEKAKSLEVAVNVEQTIRDDPQKGDDSRQTVVKSSFQTKSDADCSSEMQETVDGTGEASSSMKIGTDNMLVTDTRIQTSIQDVCSNNVFTSNNSEQMTCNNEKESRSNIAVSSNGVESYDSMRMLHDSEGVCNITATGARQSPIDIVQTAVDNPSSSRENFSCDLLRNADGTNLSGNVESALENRHLLDGNAKLVADGQTKNCADDDKDTKVMELVGSEQETAECGQPAQVNLRLKLHKEEFVEKVSHAFEEISPKKKDNVVISGESHSLPILYPIEEVSQKTTPSEDCQRSYSPKATASEEVTGLIKPCIVDGRSLPYGVTSASEGEQNKSVVDDVSFLGDEWNFVDTSVFQYAKSSISEPPKPDFRATLHSKRLSVNCNAPLPAASTSQISADNDYVIFDGNVSEQVNCFVQIPQRCERSKSADCDVTAVRCDATAGKSCQGIGIQPNGFVLEMTTSPEVPSLSDSHPTEQLRMVVVSSGTVTGFSRHCVADVGSVTRCSAETVSYLALSSPSHKEVSLSSETLPSLPQACLTVRREDELSNREPSSSSGFDDEAICAMHSEILHSDSMTVSLSVAPVSESFASTSLEIVPSASKSGVSHSCVRQTTVSLSPADHVFFSKDARSSAFDEDVLSGPLPAKRLRTSDTN